MLKRKEMSSKNASGRCQTGKKYSGYLQRQGRQIGQPLHFRRNRECSAFVCPSLRIRRISLAFGPERIYTIPCTMETDMEFLFSELSELAGTVPCFAVCGLKEYLSYLPGAQPENSFDVILAAYLLNPLKSDYDYEDVAREQLGILIDEKLDDSARSCYEAYTAFAAAPILEKKLTEEGYTSIYWRLRCPLYLLCMKWNGQG